MKILYLTILDLDSQCGSTIHVLESVKKLRLLGNQVKLIGSSTNPYNKQELGDFTNLFFSLNLITGRIIECMFFKVLFLLNLLYLILRNIYTYDVVYIRDYYSGMMLSILGKKYICEVNGIPGEDLIKQNLRY